EGQRILGRKGNAFQHVPFPSFDGRAEKTVRIVRKKQQFELPGGKALRAFQDPPQLQLPGRRPVSIDRDVQRCFHSINFPFPSSSRKACRRLNRASVRVTKRRKRCSSPAS